MADHLRRRIRDAAATALTGLATTGARVFKSRVDALQDADLPALRITTPADTAERLVLGRGAAFENRLTLQVEYCVKSSSGYEDTVDQIEKEVMIALAANTTLGGLCKLIEPGSYEIELEGDGDKPVAIGRRQFLAVYYARMSAPDTPA